MTKPINLTALTELVRSIPRGHVTTYSRLARALGVDPNARQEIAAQLHPACRETVVVLARGAAASDALLPCWRIVDESPTGVFSPIAENGDAIAPNDPFYRIIIQPLLDEGIPMNPPAYRIPIEYVYDPTPTL